MMIFHGILHAQNVIDIHCHNVLPEFRALLEQHDAAMEETFPLPEWSVEAHLRFMEEAGISLSVLSMPAPQPWFGNAEECGRTIRDYNEFCARLKAAHPDKFRFCASLPLPDVDAAVREGAQPQMRMCGLARAAFRGKQIGLPVLFDARSVQQHAVILQKPRIKRLAHPHVPALVKREKRVLLMLAREEFLRQVNGEIRFGAVFCKIRTRAGMQQLTARIHTHM